MIRIGRVSIIAGGLILSGCTLYTKPEVPSAQSPDRFQVNIEGSYAELNNHWWKNFHNPQLNDLVQMAIETNYNYAAALKNIEIAQTTVLQNMTLLFPEIGLDFSFARNKQIVNIGNAVSSAPEITGNPGIFNFGLLAASVNYEVDVWNQVHNSVNQAEAEKRTAEGNTNVTRLTLIGSVVSNYFQIMALDENIANLKAQHKAAAEIADLTEVLFDAGLVDEGSLYTALNQDELIYSNLKVAEKQRQVYLYTLAVLVGEYPEQFTLEVKGRLGDVKFSELVPEAIPSLMLATRPDIQAAFNTVLSFGFLEKQNIAAFLPSISLGGTFGYANNTFSHLINVNNVLWTYGVNLVQLIVDYPALYAQWKQSQIQYRQAIDNYKNTVITAFSEVDGAMVSYKEDTAVKDSYLRQLHNNQELLGIADAQYAAGLVNYITYLTNDLSMLQADYNLTLQELTLTQDVVQLYKALGLGVSL